MKPINDDLYLCHMCQCWVHAALWLHIAILIFHFDAEPRSTAGLLFPLSMSQWDDVVGPFFDGVGLSDFKREGKMFFYWPQLLDSFYSSTVCPFSSFFL